MLIVNKKYKDAFFISAEKEKGKKVFVEEDDNAILGRLRDEAAEYRCEEHDGKRMECTLLFDDISSWWQVLTLGIPDEISGKADVMITTKEDLIAKTLLLQLPEMSHNSASKEHTLSSSFLFLDREPQYRNSDKTVHLVIFGATPMAEALAINTAFIAHYPNYCRDNRLRTRITLIDNDIFSFRNCMQQRYRHLFEHSYHRSLNLDEREPHCVLHRPMYEGKRKDFVDIEWEFVKADASNDAVRQKLSEWTTMDTQQLTVAVCGSNPNSNATTALTLPDELNANNIPVLFQTFGSPHFNYSANRNIIPFSEKICDISTLHTLKQMAMRVNYIYNHCYSLAPEEPVTAPNDINLVKMERQWAELTSFGKRYSNVLNAMTLATKMHSVGLTVEDWKAYYALSKEEIDTLSEVEHNRWSVEELLLGYRPVTDEEQAAVDQDINLKRKLRDRKIHYDLRAFSDLREDATGKNVAVYDKALTQGIPLILKTCTTD